MREFDKHTLRPEVREMFKELCRERSRVEAQREKELGGRVVLLPTPQLSFWPELMAEVIVQGEWRDRIVLHVPKVVFITWDLHRGRVHVQFKAGLLWTAGWGAAAEYWLSYLSWCCGEDPHSLDDAYLNGKRWRVCGLELCCDFEGFGWSYKDAQHFITPKGQGRGYRMGDVVDVEREIKEGRLVPWGPDLWGRAEDQVETIGIGTRKSNVSWCLYWKTRQIEACKDGDGSIYWSHWEAGGWRNEPGREVVRVELRLCKRGLKYLRREADENGELLRVNLEDPMALCDREILAKVWKYQTQNVRCIVPDDATRRERCRTDPRWQIVQAAADCELVPLQQDRAVQKAMHSAAVDRATDDVVRALARLAALRGHRITAPRGFRSALELAIEKRNLDVMLEYCENYRATHVAFYGPEMDAAGRDTPSMPGLQRVPSLGPNWMDVVREKIANTS